MACGVNVGGTGVGLGVSTVGGKLGVAGAVVLVDVNGSGRMTGVGLKMNGVGDGTGVAGK